MSSKIWVRASILVSFLFVSCGDNIIQRAASDYFQYREGNWWQLASDQDTMLVEVEAVDTLLQVECFPVSFGGYTKHLTKRPDAISQYIKITTNFGGADHTVIEDFIKRIELPLVDGNTWQDSLVDSIFVSGAWVKAKFYVSGSILGFETIGGYGDVYTIEIRNIEVIISPDTMMIDTIDVIEDYAPDIGLVCFEHTDGVFNLIDYEVE